MKLDLQVNPTVSLGAICAGTRKSRLRGEMAGFVLSECLRLVKHDYRDDVRRNGQTATRRQNFYVSGTETVDAEECACFVSGSDSQV